MLKEGEVLTLIKMGKRNNGSQIQGDETKELKIWETKFGEKLQKLKYGIEIAGMNLREGNCGREIEGVKLWE